MSASIDQKSYLRKYLGGPSKDKKKKKKKAVKGTGFKIIDDDLDLSKLRPLDGDELDILDEGEDAPQIAGIVDERPEDVKKLEQFKTTSKWRVVNQDDGFNSELQIEEIKNDVKETEKENEIIFGKMYSDSEDEEKKKNDVDVSPPRKNSLKKNDNDSDVSPPRKKEPSPKRDEKNEVDASPPKQEESTKERPKERVRRKPSRWADADPDPEPSTSNSPNRNADLSPPRKQKDYDSDESRKKVSSSSENKNDKRKKARSPSSDLSPARKTDRRKLSSPVRRSKKSPERHNKSNDRESSRRDKNRRDISERDKTRKQNNDPVSPLRRDKDRNGTHRNTNTSERDRNVSKEKRRSPSPKNSKRKHDSDSDLSPPRKNRMSKDKRSSRRSTSPSSKRKHDSDSDLSPPRKGRSTSHRDKYKHRSDSGSPPPTNKKMAKTLEGKMAGLQDARQLRQENEEFRRKEDEVFKKLGDDVSGRNAKAVSRKSKRATSEDKQKKKEKAERQKELDAKYKLWSKGLKQVEAQEARLQDYLHEASKPVARHKDDKDLEHSLKQVERAGDPMLQFIKEGRRERGELPPERPSYKGNCPPNRFNIRPGHRWDGVNRSNGYEDKFFQQQSKRKAQEEEAYKWSTEDL